MVSTTLNLFTTIECLHELMYIPYIIQQLDTKSSKNLQNIISRNHSVEQAHTLYYDQDDDEHTTHSIEN